MKRILLTLALIVGLVAPAGAQPEVWETLRRQAQPSAALVTAEVTFDTDADIRITYLPFLQGDRSRTKPIPLDDGTTLRPIPQQARTDDDGTLTLELQPSSAARDGIGQLIWEITLQNTEPQQVIVPDGGGAFATLLPYVDQDPVSAVGPVGPTGPQGNQGAPGSPGVMGHTGSQGPQGQPGQQGNQGDPGAMGHTGTPGIHGVNAHEAVHTYRAGATAPATPAGGSFDADTRTLTPPTGWSAGPLVPPAGQNLYFSRRLCRCWCYWDDHSAGVVQCRRGGRSGADRSPGSCRSSGSSGRPRASWSFWGAGYSGGSGYPGADGPPRCYGSYRRSGSRGTARRARSCWVWWWWWRHRLQPID